MAGADRGLRPRRAHSRRVGDRARGRAHRRRGGAPVRRRGRRRGGRGRDERDRRWADLRAQGGLHRGSVRWLGPGGRADELGEPWWWEP
ncbi:hypothetical protein EKG83_01370 [Saccharothrix syringae]|uniref:Uncharacterized protein n=1 Tax=Saccharothrix syringae TaxID=103733 RepID=A0A5Q0GQP2_SACSY|nr:hypothetical protein EKG83_01370 [Saccharothrix syringae]